MGRFATREDEVDDLFRRRRVRRPVPGGPAGDPGGRRELFDQAARAAVRVRAAGGPAGRDGEPDRVRGRARRRDGGGGARARSRSSPATTRTTAGRRSRCATGWRSGGSSWRPRSARSCRVPSWSRNAGVTEDPELARIREALLADVPDDPSERSADQNAKALLADLLDWHRREDKPGWWRYFYLRNLSPAELIDEPDALGGLTGGDVVSGGQAVGRAPLLLPAAGAPVLARGRPPTTARPTSPGRSPAVDDAVGTIDLKIGPVTTARCRSAWSPVGPSPPRPTGSACATWASGWRATGSAGPMASADWTRPPPCCCGPGPPTAPRRASRCAERARPRATRRSGSSWRCATPTCPSRDRQERVRPSPRRGRSWNSSRPAAPSASPGRRTAVINNLIGKVYECADALGATPRIGQRADKDNPHLHPRADALSPDQLEQGIRDGELDVIAGTSWLWSREQFAGSVDVLFVDEAGQLSLANVLSVAHAAGTLVLLGDPQQLAQPSEVAHPPGAGASALEHILGDHATMPADAGLLLDRTWRMHPELCRYTSDVFYDGRLTAVGGLEHQEILGRAPLRGAGLRIVEVPHEGNTNASPEEASRGGRPGPRPAWLASGVTRTERSIRSVRPTSSSSRPTTRRSGRSARRWRRPGARPAFGSGPWTSSRGVRRRSPSTRWPPRRLTRRRAAWSSCTTTGG